MNSKPPTHWVRHRAVCYLRGQGFAFGSGQAPLPLRATAPGVYCLNVDVAPGPGVQVCDDQLSTLADSAFDYGWIGPRLAGMPDPVAVVKRAIRKVKVGGHLIFSLALKVEPPAQSFTPEEILALSAELGGWLQKDLQVRDGHLLLILKKLSGKKGIRVKPRSGRLRACVVRYGALGDMIMLTPVLRQLHADGFETTLNITPYSAAVIENNPYISNLVLQEREAIPNHDLGAYWKEWEGEYDRYINLSESIEGALLKVEGRREFYTSQAWRHSKCNINYFDHTMGLAGYPEVLGTRGELHFTPREEADAQRYRERHRGKFLVLWALNGSSHHKMYAMTEPVLVDWLAEHPDARVVTLGDASARMLEFAHPQVENAAGAWPIRFTLSMAKHADLVVGPESMLVNAAGCFSTPKIVFLSHSTPENLTKYWENCVAMEPDKAISPCYPCHSLHYSISSCVNADILDHEGKVMASGPACAMGAITGERVISALDAEYEAWKLRKEELVAA